VPYKRVDLAVEAFRGMNEKLIVAGSGPELNRLKAAAGPNVEFPGFVPDDQLPGLYANCRAFLFPGYEDFGLTPLEAQAAGRPVIAYAKGGALETVVDGKTGAFFHEQTPDALREAISRFDPQTADPRDIRRHALQFDTGVFKEKIHSFITEKYQQWRDIPRDN
jgi:glycosyltransferase involved in cell wall biosynthesis